MKIQRRSLAKEIKAQRPLFFNQSGVSPICTKLYSQQLRDLKNVESYVKLRSIKCDKSISLLNCSKQICRIDESIPQVKCNTQTRINNPNESRILTRQVIKHCQEKRKEKYESLDESFKNLYLFQDKYSEKYQNYLNKHIEDSIQLKESISFNLDRLSKQQLYLKLKDLYFIYYKSLEIKIQMSIQNKNIVIHKNLIQWKYQIIIKIQITLRSTVEPSITDISPLTICDDTDNKKMKDKLKLLVSPQNFEQNHRKRQLTLPYFSKNQLNLRLNQINDGNSDSQNLTSTQTSNINSLMRNKSHLYSREIKRIHIQTEC
ncbi:unnamed protein product [Paramecium primaurelia]|uniref:Uncharacterized protein n=1 Tax=Paramecium primaurelia TaxID=5886 RepID=A0A8S1L131_PARPR|nr:unnamed protein product [Paramecium primaurelia]